MQLWVIKNGVPYDVAYALEDWELLATSIVFGELENSNQVWDWGSMTFIKRN